MRQTNVRGTLSLRGFRKLRTGAIVATGVILLGLGFLAPTVSASEQDGVWVARTVAEVKADIQKEGDLFKYVIKWGDTLSVISEASNIPVDVLQEMNQTSGKNLFLPHNELYFTEAETISDTVTKHKIVIKESGASGEVRTYEVLLKKDQETKAVTFELTDVTEKVEKMAVNYSPVYQPVLAPVASKAETRSETLNAPSAYTTNGSGNSTESSPAADKAPSNIGTTNQPVASNPSSEAPAPKAEVPSTPAPKTEEPAIPVPKAEAPATPAPKAEAPSTPAPKAEAPSTPAPKAEVPVTPAPKVEAPSTPMPKVEEPASSAPKSEEPSTPAPKVEEPSTPAPKVEEPSTPAPKVEEPSTPAPKVEEPSTPSPKVEEPSTPAPKVEEPATGTTPKAENPTEEVAPKDEKLEEAKKDGKDVIEKIAASKLSEIEKVKDEAEKTKLKEELNELKEEALAAINNAKDQDAAVAVADEYQSKIDEIDVPGEELPAPNYNKDNLTNGRNEGTTIDNGSTAIGHGTGEAPTQPASEERTTSTASPTQPSSTSEGASSFRNAPSVQARARRVARSTSEPDGTVNISYNFAEMPDIHGFLSDPGEDNTVTIPAGTSEAQAKELVKEKIQAKIKDLAARGYHVKNDIIFEQDTTVKNYNYVVTFTKEATGTSGFRMAPAVQPRASRNRRSLEQPAPQKVKVNVFYNFDQMKDIAGFLGDINGTSLEIAEGLSNEQVKAAVKSQVDAKKEELRKLGYTFKEDYVYQANGKDYNYVVTFSKATK